MTDQLLPYYLPRTFLTVSGTKKTAKSLKTGDDESIAEASIELGVEADPDDYYLLDLDRSELTDMDFTLAFTDDMRLTSANSVVTGQGSAILKGAAKIGGMLAGFSGLPRVLFAAGGSDLGLLSETKRTEGPKAPEVAAGPTYAGEKRRARAKKAASDLSARIVKLGEQAASGTLDKDLLKVTMTALDAVRAEVALFEAHHAAWQTRERNLRVEDHSFRIPLEHVPARSTLLAVPSAGNFEGDTAKMYTALQMVVAYEEQREESPDDDPSGEAPGSGHVVESIWYRRPYYTDLLLMKYEGGTWNEVDRTRQLVVGQRAPKTELPIKKSAWGKRTLDLEFSDLGMAIKVATTETSAVADAVSALAGVPGHVSSGLGSAAAFEAAVAAVPEARVARAIARLENEQKLVLDELGDDAAADAALVAEVARLENEKKRLALLKELGRDIS